MSKQSTSEQHALRIDIGHEELVIRKRYEALSIANDVLIALWFLVGSVLFFWESTTIAATWCFLLGSIEFLARPHGDKAILGAWIVKMIIAQIADKPRARVLVHQRPAVAHVRRFWMGWKKIVERAAAQDSGKLIANVRPATRHRVVD